MIRRFLGALILLLPIQSFAFSGLVVDADGQPVEGAQISIAGVALTAVSDANGRFEMRTHPPVPFSVIVTGPRGELHPPIQVASIPDLLLVHLSNAFHGSATVISSPAPNIEAPIGAATTIFGEADLAERLPHHVSEALRRLPGVTIRGRGGPAVPVLRGLASGRTLILLDDIRVVTERRAGPSATFLDPVILGSIEVARGPGSVAYGSDAFGGVIHARTRSPRRGEGETTISAIQSAGGENTTSAAVTASFDVFGGAIMAAIHGRAAGEQESAGGERTAGSSYRDRGIALVYRHGRVRTVLATTVARDVGVPSSSSSAVTSYPTESAHRFAFDVNLNEISLVGGLASHRLMTTRVDATGRATTGVSARDLSLRATRTSDHFTFGIDNASRFGLSAIDERNGDRQLSIDDASRIATGIYATYQRPVGDWLLATAGARVDAISIRNRNGFFGDHSRDDVAPSGHAALTAGPFRNVTTTLQVASGYREPSLSDRYFRGVSGRGFVVGNPDLEPERSLQFDGAVRWQARRATLALFGYHYRIANLVERYRATTDFQFRNRGSATIKGLEVEGSFQLSSSLLAQIGGAIARGEDRDTGAALDDIAPPGMNVSLRWTGTRWSAWASGLYWLADDHIGPTEASRESGGSVDLGTAFRVTQRVELLAILRNAGDTRYFDSADAASALAPGRSLSVGINSKF